MTRYELLDRIGVGGMAEIFRGKAVAAGGFEKPVAIKRILPHLSQDKRFVELLIAEAKVLSLLKHRNIVQIFDVGLGDDAKYFLVMEYVDGKDLGAMQRGLEAHRRRMPFDLVLHVGAEICEALEHAHSARAPDGKPMSLVHRDVSPSNVLLSRAGEIKLTDFGIAKRAEHEPTGHGAVRGKFAYISPEQARNEHLDPRSDVFSVGILLWELVTGRRLFSGLGDLDALRAVREAQVPRPREIDSRLTPEIDALLMSALARDVRGRPTAGQLGARLRTMRYSLEVTVGDPASELAKIIETAEEVERQSSRNIVSSGAPSASAEFELSEATVIRIHTADAFSLEKDSVSMAHAREVIDRFEDEETRQAQLTRDQMAFLRAGAHDSGELASTVEPPLPGVPPRRASDEQTRARAPLDTPLMPEPPSTPEAPTFLPRDLRDSADSGPFEAEATRLLSRGRTPRPEREPERLPERVSERMGERLPERIPERMAERGPERMPERGPERMAERLPSQPPVARPREPTPPPLTPLPAAMQPVPLPRAPEPPPPAPPPQPPPIAAPIPASYPAWGQAQLPGYSPSSRSRLPSQRPPSRSGAPRPRPRPLSPWLLVVGALVMALLAFAVTRACIHSATNRPAVESK